MSLSTDRISRMKALQDELAELENDASGDVEQAIGDAEEAVLATAENASKGTESATETLAQAEEEIAASVEQESEAAAKELGRPELADEIADRLFQRIEERGLLPAPSSPPIAEAEQVAEKPAEAMESAPAQAQATVEEDTPPEPQHWFYRKRFRQ